MRDKQETAKELLTREEEVILAKKIEAGDEDAINIMLEANLGLVHYVARKYVGRGLDYDDIFQEGCIGLLTAIKRFDWERGNKFSTMAFWWIRQSIQRAIEDSGATIRIPGFMQADFRKLLTAQNTLVQRLGREPSVNEIATAMNIDQTKARELLMSYNTQPSSLNISVGEDGETELIEIIPCDKSIQMVSNTESRQLKEITEALLTSWLNDEEEKVIRLRFGLNGMDQHTLEGVSKKMGIPLDKVRQVEDRALRKLKPRAHAKQLEIFLR